MKDIDFESLYEGLQVDDDLLIKAQLRVAARPMRHAVTQSLSDDMIAKYKVRMASMTADIEEILEESDHIEKSEGDLVLTNDGRFLFKATGGGRVPRPPAPPKPTPAPTQAKTVTPTGERKLTPSGYVHVETPGSRGGKFWRDDKGNVRYGERPHGNFQVAAAPHDVVEHYRKYYAPQPFAAHNQSDFHQALMESNVLSDADHGFMEWWHESYDDILDCLGVNRKQVEKAGGLQNVTFIIGGRPMGASEAIEEFFKMNAENFVGDPQFGDIESAEEVTEAIRGLMERYRKALHEDPKVQALAQAHAERAEAQKNAFFIKAEQTHEEYEPLAADLITKEDHADLATRFTVAMKDMGFIERGGKGGVSQKRMRGALVPKSALLLNDNKHSPQNLWQKRDQLERLGTSQLMALYFGTEAQASFSADNTYDYEPGAKNDDRDFVFGLIADKLGIGEDTTAMQTLRRKLDKTAEAMMSAFTNYNTGQDPMFGEVLKMKVKDVAGASDVMEQHMKKVQAEQARIEKILAAQEDTNFVPPPSMQNGVWNGKTLKDPKDPSKGVWAPFEYQKKYINWMLAVKRGVIAADAGMGKTPTVIAFRELLASQGKDIPAICFLPPSLMEQWPAAIAKFAPENADKILNLSGLSLEERKVALQSDMAKKAKYIFISTGTLTGDVPDPNASDDENDGTGGSDHEMVKLLQSLNGAVFIDEAHQGGYKKAGNTRHEIAKAVLKDREYAFGMTATPMPNDPMDVYHLANLFAPGSVGDEELWAGRTAGVAWNEEEGRYTVSNPEHLADLNKRLKPFVYYKAISDPDVVQDMGKGLTPLHQENVDMELSRHVNSENGLSQHDYFKEGGVIDTMVKLRVMRLIRERNEKVQNGEMNPKTGEPYEPYGAKMLEIMAGGMHVTLQRQASISPALIDPTYRKQDGGVAHTPKIKALCDDIVAHFSNDGQGGKDAKPIVVFCSYPQKAYPIIRKALAERGVDPSLIDTIAGDVAPHERGYMQDKLNKGHSKVLLVGTMSGGAGLNLQEKANKTLFLDEPWNPAAKRQAQGRVWRTGQNNPVHERTYRMNDTYDLAVEMKLAGKQAMVQALLGKQLPTEETFSVDQSVAAVVGRAKGGEFNEDQIRAMMENASKYDMASHEHQQATKLIESMGEDWENTLSEGGKGGVGATLTDKDFVPNEKAQQTLKNKGANALTQHFDEEEFRAQWELDRKKRRAKQTHEMATLMQKIYQDKGDKERADQYSKRAKSVQEEFPEEFGLPAKDKKAEKKEKPEADKKSKSKGDEHTSHLPDDQKALVKESGFKATDLKEGEKLTGVKKDPSTGRIIHQIKTKDGSREQHMPGKVEETKDVLEGLSLRFGGGKQPEQKPATATVGEAQRKLKQKTQSPEGKQAKKETDPKVQTGATGRPSKPSKSAQEAHKPTPPPTPVKPAKVVASNDKLGLQFHSKQNPFKDGSTKKIKGTDISHGEAHYVLHLLQKEAPKDWGAFLKQHVQPIWDDEDGRNAYTPKKAQEWVDKVVDAIANEGVLSRAEAKQQKGKK